MRRPIRRLIAIAAAPFVGLIVLVGASPSGAQPTASVDATSACASTIFCFVPDSVTVDLGGAVTWSDTTGFTHTVSRCNPDACEGLDGGTGTDDTFTSATIHGPQKFTQAFTGSGTYNYYCMIHGYHLMHGVVTVEAATTTEPPTTAPPTTAPPTTVPPTTVPITTQPTSAGGAVSGGTTPVQSTAAPTATLARTGDDSGLLFAVGCALIAIGIVISAQARRITSTGRRPQ